MNILISMDHSLLASADLAKLYADCNFGSYDDLMKNNTIVNLFSECSTGFFATDMDSGKVLGAARVLSDDMITSYVAEICVLSSHRGKGLAEKLLEAVTIRFNHTAIFTCGFVGMERLLQNHGLSKKQKLFACSRRPYLKNHKKPLIN